MKLTDIFHKIKQPCAKCPYKLGLVHTVANPCPQCRANGYQMYEKFRREISGDSKNSR